jgi:hypothetical protein
MQQSGMESGGSSTFDASGQRLRTDGRLCRRRAFPSDAHGGQNTMALSLSRSTTISDVPVLRWCSLVFRVKKLSHVTNGSRIYSGSVSRQENLG